MILSIILIIVALVITFFHYLQGFFSASISAILCAASVLVAFTYYEPVVDAIKPGKFADDAHALVLVSLFAITYIVLRLIFDVVVSGNVRVPVIVDKVGGAVMGLIVAFLAVGLVAVAAQALPFGPTIGGYARYRVLPDAALPVMAKPGQMEDRHVYEELATYSISTLPDGREVPHDTLLLPFDDMVLSFVNHNSSNSTAGGQSFARIHPDYLQELFGNRIGIELGAKRSAQPVAGEDMMSVLGVYTVSSLPQVDAEFAVLRKRSDEDKLPKTIQADSTHALLVVRMKFKHDATDTDNFLRISAGSVRLVAPVIVDGRATYQNFFPVGTVEGGNTLLVSKPDDFLFMEGDKAADFLFVVDAAALPDLKTMPAQIPADSKIFVEAKRFARAKLAGMKVEPLKSSDQVAVMRKQMVMDAIANSNPDVLKKQLVGSWMTTVKDSPATYTYNADGTWLAELQLNGQAMQAKGKWAAVSAGTDGLVFDRMTGTLAQRCRVTFANPNTATLVELPNGAKPAATFALTRKP